MQKISRLLPLTLLVILIALCLLWELWLAPLRGAGTVSFLVLKAVLLLLALRGFANDQIYTYKWMSLAVWLYFIEGTVRGWSDQGLSSQLAWLEAVMSVLLFVSVVIRIRQLRKP